MTKETQRGMGGYTVDEADAMLLLLKAEGKIPRGWARHIGFNAWLRDTNLLVGEDIGKPINQLMRFVPYKKHFPDWALSQPEVDVMGNRNDGLLDLLLTAEAHIDDLIEDAEDDKEKGQFLEKKELLDKKLRKNAYWE